MYYIKRNTTYNWLFDIMQDGSYHKVGLTEEQAGNYITSKQGDSKQKITGKLLKIKPWVGKPKIRVSKTY